MCSLSIHHCVKLPVVTRAFPLLPFHIWLSPIQTLNQPLKSNDATPTVTAKKGSASCHLVRTHTCPQPLKQQPTFHSITVLTLMVMSSPFVPGMLYSSPCVACRWLLQGSKDLIGGSAVCRHTAGFFVWCDIYRDCDISIITKGTHQKLVFEQHLQPIFTAVQGSEEEEEAMIRTGFENDKKKHYLAGKSAETKEGLLMREWVWVDDKCKPRLTHRVQTEGPHIDGTDSRRQAPLPCGSQQLRRGHGGAEGGRGVRGEEVGEKMVKGGKMRWT